MIGSIALLSAIVPCGWAAMTSTVQKRLVATEMAGVICSLELVLLTMAFNRMPMMDLAVALTLLSFGSGMLFVHFLGRHL